MLRKILAIFFKQHTIHKLGAKVLPSEAVYRQGRSTTKRLFTPEILAKITMCWEYYTIHLLMCDISKAFSTLDRAILLKDIQKILDPDELHLIKAWFHY